MELYLDELGYFTKSEVEELQRLLDGKSFMKFKIGYSFYNGYANCKLILKINNENYEKDDPQCIKNFFYSYVLSQLALLSMKNKKEEN